MRFQPLDGQGGLAPERSRKRPFAFRGVLACTFPTALHAIDDGPDRLLGRKDRGAPPMRFLSGVDVATALKDRLNVKQAIAAGTE